jgi:drug/metabolite transporter (DMT)-like permease
VTVAPVATPATYLKLLLTMLFWGGTWIAGRVLTHHAPPLAATAWRFLIAAAVLTPFALAPGLRRPAGADWLWALALGFFGIFLYGICFMWGLQKIEAGRAALVVALNPVTVALVDLLFFGARFTRLKCLGSALALCGCLLVIGNGDPLALLQGGIGFGETLIIGCVLCWTAYTFIGRQASRRLPPVVVTWSGCLCGVLFLLLAALGEGKLGTSPDWPLAAWVAILFLAILGTAAGYLWYGDAVQKVGATRAAAFINLVPVFAVLLGALILGERLPPAVLLGGGLVIAGVYLLNRPARKLPS